MTWPTVMLGDCGDIQGGLQVSSKRIGLPVSRPYLRVANVHRGRLDLSKVKTIDATQAEVNRTELRSGDLLFVEGHANPQEIGRVAVWDGSIEKCVHQNHLIRFRPDPGILLPHYAARWFNAPAGAKHFQRAGRTTSGLNTISANTVRSAPTLLPPLEEQHRIAGILQKTDQLRLRQLDVDRRFDLLAQSVFTEMFGDPFDNDRDWPTERVDQISIVQLGRQRSPKYQTGNHTRAYLRVANVYEDYLDLNEVFEMDFDEKDFASYVLKPGDILLNEGQSTDLVGRPAMFRGEMDNCCFQNTLLRVQVHPDRVVPEFALGVFLDYFRRGRFARLSSKTSSVAHLGKSRLAGLPFPLPPLTLQDQYRKLNSQIRAFRTSERNVAFNELFASLQARAFSGQL